MSTTVLVECWCTVITRLQVYKDRVEIKGNLGLNTLTLPIRQIASVRSGLLGITFETTGGGKAPQVQPYNFKKQKEVMKVVLQLISKNR